MEIREKLSGWKKQRNGKPKSGAPSTEEKV